MEPGQTLKKASKGKKRRRSPSTQTPPRAAPPRHEALNLGPTTTTQEEDEDEDTFARGAGPISAKEAAIIAVNIPLVAAAEEARRTITDEAIAATGITSDENSLKELLTSLPLSRCKTKKWRLKPRKDFFGSLAQYPELLMELAKTLRPKELLSLYAISRDFHDTLDGHLTHTMRLCAAFQAPGSAKIYLPRFYAPLCIPDPAGRFHPKQSGEVRVAPSIRWLMMVVHRDKAVRDILACMARQGHRMPAGMGKSLKKMWLLMDIATNATRQQLMGSKWMEDIDIYHMQMFFVKLDMRFNDPIEGPGSDQMRNLFLGQRGLSPLWRLLKRTDYLTDRSIQILMIRYEHIATSIEHRNLPLLGVPPAEIGIGHLEGWGRGRVHLMRPDELVIREAVRRALGLKQHIMLMMIWGYVDPVTGENTPPTAEDKYMSDDEEVGERDPEWNDYHEREYEEVTDDEGVSEDSDESMVDDDSDDEKIDDANQKDHEMGGTADDVGSGPPVAEA